MRDTLRQDKHISHLGKDFLLRPIRLYLPSLRTTHLNDDTDPLVIVRAERPVDGMRFIHAANDVGTNQPRHVSGDKAMPPVTLGVNALIDPRARSLPIGMAYRALTELTLEIHSVYQRHGLPAPSPLPDGERQVVYPRRFERPLYMNSRAA
nr:hypothetical protein OH820_15265 [Streptomyces sp. NBC_00857]